MEVRAEQLSKTLPSILVINTYLTVHIPLSLKVHSETTLDYNTPSIHILVTKLGYCISLTLGYFVYVAVT
jgi:hypothetical protein